MSSASLTFEFDDMPLLSYTDVKHITWRGMAMATGRATIEYEPDGEWQIDAIELLAYRSDAYRVETYAQIHSDDGLYRLVLDALHEHYSDQIQEDVSAGLAADGIVLRGSNDEHRIGCFEAGVGRWR